MKNKTFSAFYKKYLTVLLIILIAGLAAVWIGLKLIQKNYDSEDNEEIWLKSQRAFEAYVSGLTAENWADLWVEKHPGSFDEYNIVLSVMDEKFNGNVNYAKARSYTDEAPVYVIENDEQTLAEISMEQDSETGWKIVSTEFRFEGDKSTSVAVPSGCSVTCNGTQLDSSYITATEDYFFMEEYSGDLKNAVKLETWTVSGQLSEPQLSVSAPGGMKICESIDGKSVLAQDPADEELCKKAEEFFNAYNKYGLYGYYDITVNMRTAASLCKEDSQAYTLIYESLEAIKLAPCHSVYTTNKDMGPVTVWADNAVSIDITYDTETTYGANEKDYFNGTYRILMIDFGNGYEICGFMNI